MVGKHVRLWKPFAGAIIIGIAAASAFVAFLAITIAHAEENIDLWWPVDGVTLHAQQPIKALVQGRSVESYRMYWSVDGGQQVEMWNDYRDYPHKEQTIDFTNWNWRGAGPYAITLKAVDRGGVTIGQRTVRVYVYHPGTAPSATTAKSITPTVTPTKTAAQTPKKTTANTPTQTMTAGLYVAAVNNASKQAEAWRSSRSQDAEKMDFLAKQPVAVWFGGWNADVQKDAKLLVDAAAKTNSTASMILYNVPGRDCGGYSAGGTASSDAYKKWIDSFAAGVGSSKAIIVLEPDALAGITCLSEVGQNDRYALLNYAIDTLKKNGNARVYLDAGHSNWIPADEMAKRLQKGGIGKADGFSLNVSNFRTTEESTAYGEKISAVIKSATGNAPHFVVDTSRNGQGPLGSEWCNPAGRGLGKTPTLNTGHALIDGLLWLKAPGESDGSCNGAPAAGVWWPEYALGLIERRAQ